MKKNTFYISILLISLILSSCGQSKKSELYENESYAMTETEVSTKAEVPSIKEVSSTDGSKAKEYSPPNFLATNSFFTYDDGVHKFIRTANLKFKVDEVVSSTSRIEEIVAKNQGFIIKSNISNNIYNSSRVKVSADSILEVYTMNLNCNMELRVPVSKLDTTLRELAPLAVVVDYRNLEAQDITAQLMAEGLKKKRNSRTQQRVTKAVDNKGQKLNDITEAEATTNHYSEQEDAAIVADYELNDQIAYSRISINLYQNPAEYRKMVKNQEELKDYDSGIGNQLLNGLKNGWSIVMTILVALTNIWPFILLIVVGIVVYVKYNKNRNKE